MCVCMFVYTCAHACMCVSKAKIFWLFRLVTAIAELSFKFKIFFINTGKASFLLYKLKKDSRFL